MKKRKKKKKLPLRMLMVGLILTGVFLSLFVFFKIESIEIAGTSQYSDNKIIEASGISKGDNLLRFIASARADRITTGLPYILSAKIKRVLPSKLIIEVVPVTAAAAIKTDNGYLVVDSNGKLLEKTAAYNGCVIIGLAADYDKSTPGKVVVTDKKSGYEQMGKMIEQLDKLEILSKTNLIDIRSPLDISFVYSNRIMATVGTVTELEYKLEMFVEVAEKRESENFVGSIDLSKSGEATVHDGETFLEEYKVYLP